MSSTVASPTAATREQLITRLRTHTNEVQRAVEELQLLIAERECCCAFLLRRQEAIDAALHECQQRADALRSRSVEVPQCSSFGAQQPAAGSDQQYGMELQYCEGLMMLLQDAFQAASAQAASAHAAFNGNYSGGGGNADDYDCFDEEEEAM